MFLTPAARAADSASSNSPSGDILLLDSMGHAVEVPSNEVPANPLPAEVGEAQNQIPNPERGSSMPEELRERTARHGHGEFQWFPPVPPSLMPYLASQDDYGNTAARPGPLFPFAPFETWVQDAKYALSDYGFRYAFNQTLTYANLSGVKQGENNLSFYTLDLKSKWAIYDAPDAGTAGWISSRLGVKTGLDSAADTQSAKSNLGTLSNPTGIWSSVNGVRVPELAWQQSLLHGQFVAVAGMVSQRNYLDDNLYADTGRGKFLNSALIHSEVLPLAQYNFGFNLQWQPVEEWYAMLGGSAGKATAGTAPWLDFSFNKWSLPLEIGFAPRNLLNLGPGIYRIQPFVASIDGYTSGGLGFNFQQQLGEHSPLGWFGRFGFGDSRVSGNADAQIGTGFVMQGPFKHLFLQRTSNDLLGTGFVWSQPSATTNTVYHENEYIWETVYALQLTPLIKFQPDLQFVWNPAFHSENHACVFQLQLVLQW